LTRARAGDAVGMSQFEQENDLGRGGGEVDDETMDAADRTAAERRSSANIQDGPDQVVPEGEDERDPQPWGKLSSGERGDRDPAA
jgi:hypothetical protein